MKTQKKSMKKKALLSSLSMLMVATVAVGSATFAWFTANPNATASGLKLKATASKGLMIQTQTHGAVSNSFWGHDDYLNYSATANGGKGGTSTTSIALNPTSFDLSGTGLGAGYTVEAAASNASAADKTKAVVTAVANTDYYEEQIKCKVTGSGEKAGLSLEKITFTANPDLAMSKALRIAVQYTDVEHDAEQDKDVKTTSLVGVYALADATQTNNYLKAPEGYVSNSTTYEEFTKTSKAFAIAPNSASTIGNVDPTGKDYLTVTIYLDGESDLVYSDVVDVADLITDVNIVLKAVETKP